MRLTFHMSCWLHDTRTYGRQEKEHWVQRTGLNARTRAGIINPRLFIGEQIINMTWFHAILIRLLSRSWPVEMCSACAQP